MLWERFRRRASGWLAWRREHARHDTVEVGRCDEAKMWRQIGSKVVDEAETARSGYTVIYLYIYLYIYIYTHN
jgi:hypothetical protein